ncbi:nucleotidyltransferase domain-containing protein [bacterium]|nr:nucleotidyltransferase domain-containing protein [bacterium]
MKFGLSDKEIKQINSVFSQFEEIESVIIFGSRAAKNEFTTSDIDLALKGAISIDVLAKVKTILEEETLLPYFFDVLDYNSINNFDLKDKINREGEVFYLKEKQ